MITVYLAGGMKVEWREKLKCQLKNEIINGQVSLLDPTQGNSPIRKEYSRRDLFQIIQSDIVFGFMEESNPSGIGLALEIGYAKGLGKFVILVNQSDNRYYAIVEETADITFSDFKDAVEFLRRLIK